MNKKIMSFFCEPKKAAKNIFILALMIFLCVYTSFQILPSFTQKIETETALKVSKYQTNKTSGYIFRDETPILKTTDGVPVSLVKDGDRVSKGQHFANVYMTKEYTDLQNQINDIESKIEILEKSMVETDAYITDITKTDKEINNELDKIYENISSGNLTNVSKSADDLLVNLNKRELIVNISGTFNSEISRLKSEKTLLESKINTVSNRIIATSSGYFYGDVDGYENIFTVDKLENLTLESFEALCETPTDDNVKNNSVGKLVNDFVWYVVCVAEKTQSLKYETGTYYNIRFSDFSETTQKMKLENIVKTNTDSEVLLVFRTNTAQEGFTFKRNQSVDIIEETYTGYAIPKDAIRIVNGEMGVYVLKGDIVRFRIVDIIFEDEDYYIARIPTPKNEDENGDEDEYISRYLSLYDSIIIKGKNLFDGKIVT